jgi:hypothetical protein
MKVPVWYLMAKIDVGGGGWYRARLIDKAIEYFDEWWLAGTDVTRHWAATGIHWSADASDITNQYLGYGVCGGILSVILFIGILTCCFKQLSGALRHLAEFRQLQFTVWCLGCVLFGHVVSMLSVSYYDQSIAVLYSFLGVIALGQYWFSPVEPDHQPVPEPADMGEMEVVESGSGGAEMQGVFKSQHSTYYES